MIYDAVVVGAGLAGLRAAMVLAMQGRCVCILEARSKLGGRTQTISKPPIELGPLYINGRGTAQNPNPLASLLDHFNIKTLPVDPFNSDSYDTEGNRCSIAKLYDSLEDQLKGPTMLIKEAKGMNWAAMPSLASILSYTSKNIPTRDSLPFWTRKLVTATLTHHTGADINELSLQHLMQNIPYAGNKEIMVGGYQKLIDGLYQQMLQTQNITLHLNSPVKEIHHSPAELATVVTHSGECYAASSILCTVPLGVLKNNHIHFSPPLSAPKKTAIEHLKTGAHNCVVLEFSESFWPNHVHYLHPNHSDVSLWPEYLNLSAFSDVKIPILVAQLYGKYAQFVGKTNNEIIDMALQPLRAVYGSAVEKLTHATMTHWDSDPYSLGGSPFCTVGCTQNDIDALEKPEVGGLHFAGDLTSLGLNASLEGAYLSGTKAGFEIDTYLFHKKAQQLNQRPRF
jgi:monoamine oxidase